MAAVVAAAVGLAAAVTTVAMVAKEAVQGLLIGLSPKKVILLPKYMRV